MLARALGAIGRTLITLGVLILLFVAYELWGTGLQEASAQRQLNREFAGLLARQPKTTTTTPPVTTDTSTAATTSTAVTSSTTVDTGGGPSSTAPPETAPADLPLPETGGAVAQIRIPKISVVKTIVQGVELAQLKKGPGHYPDTPLPGQRGNVAIAGHRTTYGAPFNRIDQLNAGDDVVITTVQGTFTYRVDSKKVVTPSDVSVLDDRGDNRLTLTACHPEYSARQRIVVSGVLVGSPVATIRGQDAPAVTGTAQGGGTTILPGEEAEPTVLRGDEGEPTTVVPGEQPRRRTKPVLGRNVDGGLDGLSASKTPAFAWGGLCALVFAATWLASRLIRRRSGNRLLPWAPYLIGTPVFLIVLYVFFENFSRLLPANF